MKYRWTLGSLIVLLLTCTSLSANDCSTPTLIVPGGGPYTLAFDNTADFSGTQQDPCVTTGIGDAWFRWSPGGTNALQGNLAFNIKTNFSGVFDVYLLYSESVDLGDPCEFPGAGGSGNLTGLTRYQSLCGQAINGTATDSLIFENLGLDGSGTFYLVVEWISGSNGGTESVIIDPQLTGTCPAPANDACGNAIQLTVGNGIDSNYAMPTSPAWSDAIKGTIQCATKVRFSSACPAGGGVAAPTEDHYARRFRIGFPFNVDTCGYIGKVGDSNGTFYPVNTITGCDAWLENTVWYSFTAPLTASDWQVHLGSSGTCAQEPNNMVMMLLQGVDCTDADVATRIDCGKFGFANLLPSAAGTLDGPFGAGVSLTAGQTYYIVLDGTRASQCDFCILLTRSAVNPVLPATVENLGGWNQGPSNFIAWQTSSEIKHDYFTIERSTDGQLFESIGSVKGVGESASIQFYNFEDRNAPFGTTYYRLNIVDINGMSFASETIEITREQVELALHKAYPVPFRESLTLYYSTPSNRPLEVRMVDIHGKIVYRRRFETQAGSQELSVETSGLAAGMYILQLDQDGRTVSRKVVK